MKTRATILVLFSLALAAVPPTAGADPSTHAGHALGSVNFPTSCSAAVQTDFNRAVALLHHMTYPQAREAFRAIATRDPGCAMAHWGVAMTLFQPLWPTRPSPADLQLGLEEVRKARSPEPPTQRERLFVAAAAAFFEEPSLTYWERIGRWEQAMQKVHAAFPQDPEATAFYSLALLAVTPPDRTSRQQADRAAELLIGVYRQNQDHPGAMHYLVHANDVPGREHELLEIVHKYETVAPRNPHALHMPTHIYTRLGRWDAVIRGNMKAAEAALEHPAGDQGQFVWDEFPHAIEYVVYGHLQQGADEKALEQLDRLRSTQHLEPTFKTAFHLASTQARYALERRKWNEAHALHPREPSSLNWDAFTWPEAVTWFARGLGAAREGQLDDARAAIRRLLTLEATANKAGEDLFTRNIRVLRLATSAWLAHAEKKDNSAVSLMKEAAQLEESTPKHAVTPAPTLPAYEMLGDLLSDLKRPSEALVAYEHSLTLYPERFNSLLGAARAAQSLGDEGTARKMYQRLVDVAPSSSRESVIEEARRYARR
jgi:tetratricopeptide (TPR) repeat protein